MDFLRRIIKQISDQLGGLKAAEKTVVILLILIMGFAVYWMMQYSATRQMVPLLDQVAQSLHHTIEGRMATFIHAVAVMELSRPVNRQPHKEAFLGQEPAPVLI